MQAVVGLAQLCHVPFREIEYVSGHQKAVKLNPQDPQARVNLAMAMLETAQTGVRQHVEVAGQIMMAAPELREEIERNFEEGATRKPDWKSLNRVKSWLFE